MLTEIVSAYQFRRPYVIDVT